MGPLNLNSRPEIVLVRRHPAPRTSRRWRASFLVCCTLLIAAGTAPAAEPGESWAYDLAGEVMSPFCPGRTLSSCPSPQAAELIQWIILQENAGATRAEVEEQLYARYGDVIRSAPKPEGWGLAAYVIPVLASLLGIALVAWVLRRLSGRDTASASLSGAAAAASVRADPASGSGVGSEADDEIARLVDRELEQI